MQIMRLKAENFTVDETTHSTDCGHLLYWVERHVSNDMKADRELIDAIGTTLESQIGKHVDCISETIQDWTPEQVADLWNMVADKLDPLPSHF